MIAVRCIIFACLWTQLILAQVETLNGEGMVLVTLFLDKIIYGYKQTQPDLQINFAPTEPSKAIHDLKKGDVDYAFTRYGTEFAKDLVAFPWFGQSYGFCYNLPELSGTPHVVNLTNDNLIAIFNNTIRRWDHAALRPLNPALAAASLTEPTISVYLRSGNLVTNNFYNSYMGTIWPAYPYKDLDYIPLDYAQQNNISLTREDFISMFYPLASVPGALVFIPISLISLFGETNVRCVSLLSESEGVLREPSVEAAKSQMEVALFNSTTGQVTLPPTSHGWPLVSISYLYLNVGANTTAGRCEIQRETLKFFRWALLSPNAYQPLYSDGYVVIFGSLRDQVLKQMSLLTCDGNFSMAYDIQFNLPESVRIALISISTVFLFVIIVIGFFMNHRYETKPIGKVYNFIIMFATLVSYVALLLYSIPPDDPSICQLRSWFTFCSVSIFIGAIFVRNIQMKAIQDIVDKGKFKKKINNALILAVGMFTIVGAEIVLLLIWQVMDPPMNNQIVVNDWQLVSRWVCSSGNTQLWYNLQFGYFILLSVFGIFIVYSTWNIRKQVDDARMIAMAVYVALVIQIGSFFIINSSMTQTDLYYWAHIYILGIEITFSFSIFVPKILRLYKKHKSSSQTPEKGSSTVNTNNTNTNTTNTTQVPTVAP